MNYNGVRNVTFYETFRATYRNRVRFGLGAVPFRTSQMSQEWIEGVRSFVVTILNISQLNAFKFPLYIIVACSSR